MSGLVASVDEPKAVVVAFHGGSSTAAYFDCPGHPSLSLLRMGADRGFTMVALDRPGYGSSAPYPDAMERPEQRIALVYGAIDKILGANPRGAGCFSSATPPVASWRSVWPQIAVPKRRASSDSSWQAQVCNTTRRWRRS